MKKRHIIVVIDRSGSMLRVRKDTEGGLAAFLEAQKTDIPTTVTLHQFDHEHNVVYRDVPLAEVPTYVLQPRGNTSLCDAIGRAVLGAPETDEETHTTVVILTDGQDNTSAEHTPETVAALITEKTAKGWTFVFLGANQDAITAGSAFGIGEHTSLTYTGKRTKSALTTAGNMIVRGVSSGHYGFTDEEREEAQRS